MKPRSRLTGFPALHLTAARLLLACAAFFCAFEASGQSLRSQTFELTPGWNALFLEVDPQPADPKLLFADVPVDAAAVFVPSRRGAQFVDNPSASMLKAYGWSVWYAPRRSDAFLGTLTAIYGGKPYLVHATTNATWTVTGPVAPVSQTKWMPNAYNLVGFPVQSPGGPTFRQFFQASPAHDHNKIYRLVDGTWRQVLDPGAATMRAGEAFWIYCNGHSDYPGPLEVTTPSHLGLVLSSQSGSTLNLRNRTGHPLALSMEHIVEEGVSIPLSVPAQAYDQEAKVLRTVQLYLGTGSWTQELPTLEAGGGLRLPFVLRLREMTAGESHSLLRLVTDLGTVAYVPVSASREDLP